jgi:hypothetical protein
MSAPRLLNKSPDMTPTERDDTNSITQPSAKVNRKTKGRNLKFDIDSI